ncbi:MAG TPA: Uma2 family endonuclease [Planctomycetaceae bacterium]|nr:Uma2 family endonuclease [Planctomycetaceae bacterium]
MQEDRPLTVEEFLAVKPDLPEAGRWHELVAGHIRDLQPPSVRHTTVVFNFSKALGQFLETNPCGYACYELGLIVARNPDTVRFPALSFFTSGERFAEWDQEATEHVPALIFDVISTPKRRQEMPRRLAEYFAWGVQEVWVVEPEAEVVRVYTSPRACRVWDREARLDGSRTSASAPLQGFSMPVGELFQEPEWWQR